MITSWAWRGHVSFKSILLSATTVLNCFKFRRDHRAFLISFLCSCLLCGLLPPSRPKHKQSTGHHRIVHTAQQEWKGLSLCLLLYPASIWFFQSSLLLVTPRYLQLKITFTSMPQVSFIVICHLLFLWFSSYTTLQYGQTSQLCSCLSNRHCSISLV